MMSNKYKIFVATLFCLLLTVLSPAYALDANANAKDVADKLNELYSHTKPCDNNEPAYYCSGIVIHGQKVPVKDDKGNLYASWYLPSYRDVGSFSYLRADITPHTGEPIWSNTGFILTPLDDVKTNQQFSYKIYCAYPGDGASFGDADESCHFNIAIAEDVTVDSNEIKSVDDYIKLLANAYSPQDEWQENSLGFRADKDGFDLAMQISKYIFKDHIKNLKRCKDDNLCSDHNEVIVSAWDKNKVDAGQVPIIAFFATIHDGMDPSHSRRYNTSDAEMEQLFKDADAYSQAANNSRRIPVITIDMAKLRSGAQDIFAPAVRPQ